MSVKEAPQFLQALPPETDATDGDIVTFQVKLDLQTPSKISWLRCGEPLVPAPGRREIIEHEDGWYELIISNVSEEDDGEYECRAENPDGITSCFGSLYYYQRGAPCTITDVTMESSYPDEGDGRQSGLLILIDDGSHTEEEECVSGGTNRKSLTVSEQMQGIIEDLTQSTQGDQTGSLTIEKEDDDQFNSDIESRDDLIEEALAEMQGSQDTLVADIASPDLKTTMSEGAEDPYAIKTFEGANGERCRSNPNNVSTSRTPVPTYPWPPETMVTFDLPPDTSTTSVDLPQLDTEGHGVSSARTIGSETPFGVAEITEESVDIDLKDGLTSTSPPDGATTDIVAATSAGPLPRAVAFQDVSLSSFIEEDGRDQNFPPRFKIGEESSFTSVTEIQGAALMEEGLDQNKMFSSSKSSFRSSSYKYSAETTDDLSRTSVQTTSVTSRVTSTRALEDEDDSVTSLSAKRSKISAYEADESSLSTSVRSVDKAISQESSHYALEAATDSKVG